MRNIHTNPTVGQTMVPGEPCSARRQALRKGKMDWPASGVIYGSRIHSNEHERFSGIRKRL